MEFTPRTLEKNENTPFMKKRSNKKFIYSFGSSDTEGSSDMKQILGSKGANLAEMSRLDFPVPPGFTLSTELCQIFEKNQSLNFDEIFPQIEESLAEVERVMGKTFGSKNNPLLVSVRSGAPVSMPGMMDTILNLGLNRDNLEGLAKQAGCARFAWDTYRRFIQMYSHVVMGANSSLLEVYLDDFKNQNNYTSDADILAKDWEKITNKFKEFILRDTGKVFPEDPRQQLWSAIEAVFKSWQNPRAIIYRKNQNLNSSIGTAVNVQAMVFGNRGQNSATGVVFTRNPSTGEKSLFGEFLINAQGEDVVAGIRTPQSILDTKNQNGLQNLMPKSFSQLSKLCDRLEKHYRYIQDIEFTIEEGKLWLLQTRNGKCSTKAQIKIICDLIDENLLDEKEALKMISPSSLETCLHPTIDSSEKRNFLGQGLPASPGGAVGEIIFDADLAVKAQTRGAKVILVRSETSPEDISGMISAEGILTTRGGMTSHAAVVARSMGKPCVVGCEQAQVDTQNKTLKFHRTLLREGDVISIDGSSGEIFKGALKTKPAHLDKNFFKLMKLADKYSRMKVRANADTPDDVKKAKEFGATGVGLCRTEHMFFAPSRIDIMRKMIMSEDKEERQTYLDELFQIQKEDFRELFQIMDSCPVTVRFLDPPLHEFLPHNQEEQRQLAKKFEWSEAKLQAKLSQLKESNPMLGHRGCRLAITYPEIYIMQTRAVVKAYQELKEQGHNPKPEIMLPLIAFPSELKFLKALCQKELENSDIPIGTMLELPASCLQAGEIAQHADFISFGTNDLTQTTLGISRDDSVKFLTSYMKQNLIQKNPFSQIDEKSVGKLMSLALKSCEDSKIKIGVCGEHGGDPKSLKFFHKLGIDYVSCSPYRIPIARLAAAQAQLEDKNAY